MREGARLAYERLGDPGRPPLLLLHNACATFRAAFEPILAPLAARFHLIGPDLRGHGASTNPSDRLDLRELADDAAALLDHLGIERVHVLAFSGGASAALYLVTRHPARVATQVLVGSHYTVRDLPTRGEAFWDAERMRTTRPLWWRALARLHGSEERLRALLRWWAEEDRHRPDFTREALAAIAQPTLLVAGERDRITPVAQTREMAAWMPHAELVLVPGVGHDVIREATETFLAAAFSFWERYGVV